MRHERKGDPKGALNTGKDQTHTAQLKHTDHSEGPERQRERRKKGGGRQGWGGSGLYTPLLVPAAVWCRSVEAGKEELIEFDGREFGSRL